MDDSDVSSAASVASAIRAAASHKRIYKLATDAFLVRQLAGRTYNVNRDTFVHAWIAGYMAAIDEQQAIVTNAMAIYNEACKGKQS